MEAGSSRVDVEVQRYGALELWKCVASRADVEV